MIDFQAQRHLNPVDRLCWKSILTAPAGDDGRIDEIIARTNKTNLVTAASPYQQSSNAYSSKVQTNQTAPALVPARETVNTITTDGGSEKSSPSTKLQ